jgi:hypothetical protein
MNIFLKIGLWMCLGKMLTKHLPFVIVHIFFPFFSFPFLFTLFGPFLPPAPCPCFQPPSLPGSICSAFFSNFVEEKTAIIRKTRHFAS